MPNSATTFAAARAENYAWVNCDPSHFAEAITQYPLGVVANAVAIPAAIVHLDAEGDTPVDTKEGAQVVRYCDVSIPILAVAGEAGNLPAITVTIAGAKGTRDTFLIRGELWTAQKIIKRTLYRVLVRCRRTVAGTTQKTRL